MISVSAEADNRNRCTYVSFWHLADIKLFLNDDQQQRSAA